MKKLQPQSNKVSITDRLLEIPELPSILRYNDKFNDRILSIERPNDNDIWTIYESGVKKYLDFTKTDPNTRKLIKYWTSYLIQSLSPATVIIYFTSILNIKNSDLIQIINASKFDIKSEWNYFLAKKYTVFEARSIKSVLQLFCKFNLNGWTSDYLEFLSKLPLPAVDKFAGVRTGDKFLSVFEEATLVEYFDSVAYKIHQIPETISDSLLINISILMCSYQFGMRVQQIAMLQMRDVRIWTDNDGSIQSVHLTFKKVKQKSSSKALPLTRKVKHEWSILLVELIKRSSMNGLAGTDKIFQVTSSSKVTQIVVKLTRELLPYSRTPTELRHTAAQRMVDAGANEEELAEFMGHSDIDTGLVYFQTSPNQAERVNRALGISEIYKQVSKIAHDRFISPDELSKLKGDQQIGGAPHGIPITGIGGCSAGQPACPSNPVTACYGCRKFMPINDVEMHQKVLADLREVVSFFSEASRADNNSPAYLQLQRTISNVQSIISEIEEGSL